MNSVQVLTVAEPGITLSDGDEVILDVTFDGRRVWSFWLLRDSEPQGRGQRFVPWADSLQKYLDGVSRLAIVEHLSGRVLYDAETRFGTSTERIAIVNADGKPLGIDKSGRMALTFDTRTAEQVTPLLDSIEEVLRALRAAGIEAFPAYGTLLGAVRGQKLIGHDSDADLGYVSKHHLPYDVIRESFALQRNLAEKGYRITRYSGAAFKVDVIESDGSVRGLDVFGGYMSHGHLYLMGEVGTPFRPDWIFPLGSCVLEGRTLPAPAHPEHLLAAMYGEGWRTPDPAFHFETPRSTTRKLNGWFRGTRTHRDDWDRRFSTTRDALPSRRPSDLARFAFTNEGIGSYLDLGTGRGSDAWWLARRKCQVLGYDFIPSASRAVQTEAAERSLDLTVRHLNLLEWRSVFAEGARICQAPGPRTLVCRDLADFTPRFGRHSLWRLADMALRDGGRMYLEFLTEGAPARGGRPLSVDLVAEELRARGAEVVSLQTVDEESDAALHRKARMVIGWHT